MLVIIEHNSILQEWDIKLIIINYYIIAAIAFVEMYRSTYFEYLSI